MFGFIHYFPGWSEAVATFEGFLCRNILYIDAMYVVRASVVPFRYRFEYKHLLLLVLICHYIKFPSSSMAFDNQATWVVLQEQQILSAYSCLCVVWSERFKTEFKEGAAFIDTKKKLTRTLTSLRIFVQCQDMRSDIMWCVTFGSAPQGRHYLSLFCSCPHLRLYASTF